MLMLMLLANWNKYSYLQMDICTVENWLPAEIAFELSLCHADGWSLAGYYALRGQLLRLEEALCDGWEVDGVTYDVDWFSKSLIAATVPPEIAAVIEAIAVDLTPFPAWAVCREFISQADAERAIRQAYINKLPDGAPVPRLDMTSPQAREIAAELGITLGPDGLVVRSLDLDARTGIEPLPANRHQKSSRVSMWQQRLPPGPSTGPATPSRHPSDLRCPPTSLRYTPRQPTRTRPQKQDGHGLGTRDRPKHHQRDRRPRRDSKDQDVRDPAREDRLELHMRVSDEERVVQIGAHRETALDIGGTFYHQWLPQHLRTCHPSHKHPKRKSGSINSCSNATTGPTSERTSTPTAACDSYAHSMPGSSSERACRSPSTLAPRLSSSPSPTTPPSAAQELPFLSQKN